MAAGQAGAGLLQWHATATLGNALQLRAFFRPRRQMKILRSMVSQLDVEFTLTKAERVQR